MQFLKNTVGQKIVTALTGLILLIFVMIHLIGNSSVFIGHNGLNAYAAALHRLGPLVWLFRIFMFTVLCLHIFLGIKITLGNMASKPDSCAVTKRLRSTFFSRNMIWTGIFTAIFLSYHILHFTIHAINPELSASRNLDQSGRPDVFGMVFLNFRSPFISLLYLSGLSALYLHLAHGIRSMFQTLGLNTDMTSGFLDKAGVLAAAALFLAYLSIPLSVLAGFLRY